MAALHQTSQVMTKKGYLDAMEAQAKAASEKESKIAAKKGKASKELQSAPTSGWGIEDTDECDPDYDAPSRSTVSRPRSQKRRKTRSMDQQCRNDEAIAFMLESGVPVDLE